MPDNTVYEVVVVGVTVIEDVLAPVDHTKGPVPEEDNVVLAPKQIMVLLGVIFIDNDGAIDTVAMAVVVQAPVPDKTVYVVVALGVTVTLAALVGFEPELAVQINGPPPDTDNEVLSPKQIVVFEGVILIDGVVPTDTVATAEAVQLPVPDKTV